MAILQQEELHAVSRESCSKEVFCLFFLDDTLPSPLSTNEVLLMLLLLVLRTIAVAAAAAAAALDDSLLLLVRYRRKKARPYHYVFI
jgi:hypothetical protein